MVANDNYGGVWVVDMCAQVLMRWQKMRNRGKKEKKINICSKYAYNEIGKKTGDRGRKTANPDECRQFKVMIQDNGEFGGS